MFWKWVVVMFVRHGECTTELDTWKWLEWQTSCYVHYINLLKKKISINLECYGCMFLPGLLPCQARMLWDNA